MRQSAPFRAASLATTVVAMVISTLAIAEDLARRPRPPQRSSHRMITGANAASASSLPQRPRRVECHRHCPKLMKPRAPRLAKRVPA